MTNVGKVKLRSINELLLEPHSEKKPFRHFVDEEEDKITESRENYETPDSGVFMTVSNSNQSLWPKLERKFMLNMTKTKKSTTKNKSNINTFSRKKRNHQNQSLPKNQTQINNFFKIKANTGNIESLQNASSSMPPLRLSLPRKCKNIIDTQLVEGHKAYQKFANNTTGLFSENQIAGSSLVSAKTAFIDRIIQSKIVKNGECVINLCSDSEEETKNKYNSTSEKIPFSSIIVQEAPRPKKRKRQCPAYKVISGTKFAVDAFQFGTIEGVTVHFLTHFHADHYIGLTKKFQFPIYLSAITGRLVHKFIGVNKENLHEMKLHQPIYIDDVEITAIDANHCPGAIMLLFKLKSGKCILHTGDFRACPDMESEPEFWNNFIHTIYLDTTYISTKYAFQKQWESVLEAQEIIRQFREKHNNKRILYICGAYLIGKERFWMDIAKEFDLSVWTEEKRRSALEAIENKEILQLLRDDPMKSNMHVISIAKLNYQDLSTYFNSYKENYDILLAFRPSGWENNSRPQYRGNINIVGIDYSEHSSFEELRRFVRFLKPCEVISTIPIERNLNKTHKVPRMWYKYEKLNVERNFQPTITTYLSQKNKVAKMDSAPSKQVDIEHVKNSSPLHLSSMDASNDWLS